ncbi:hypothetical protein SETIT_6G193900v2 [Setaria italica]|uniref:F-box domain-containing protein n=1 Tax=Setaria italica TaxID=4555 RepID=K3YLJ6_SETIT|nr:F-box protein At3g07870-like [Setaria italica]RCV31638.1 hypothetical protein SETIT_6G193900v2 [Setaria italica]
MDGEGCWDFPSDAFAEILLRLPATSRRRFRLVCRHWCDVIDDRAPARPSEPKPLTYVIRDRGWSCATGSAYVIDDPAAEGRCREVWRGGPLPATGCCFDTRMVGTCNGLLCLCDNTRPGGAVSLVNPATGESLALPPLPGHARIGGIITRWHETYGFVQHPATGRYTVVHLPCYSDRTGQLDAVRAFTLGEAVAASAWRDVAAPVGANCRLDAGLVAVDGAAYWVTKGSERVMSFDAEDERVAPVAALPVAVVDGNCCHLTEVRGRLGFVVTVDEPKLARVEVWVLEGGRDGRAWSCRYRVQVHGAPKASRQQLARPHFVFARAGECVLTIGPEDRESVVFAHRLAGAGRLQCGEVRTNERKPGTPVARARNAHIRTFAYVETREPLSVYSRAR